MVVAAPSQTRFRVWGLELKLGVWGVGLRVVGVIPPYSKCPYRGLIRGCYQPFCVFNCKCKGNDPSGSVHFHGLSPK